MKFLTFFLTPLLMSVLISRQALALSYERSSLQDVYDWFILLDYNPAAFNPAESPWDQHQMVILDPDRHPPVPSGSILKVAYLSVGEAETYRFYWRRIRNEPWVLEENPHWEGNYYVDIRAEAWQSLILNEAIPRILRKGFQGLFLDTLDTAAFLESMEPRKFEGAQAAMVSLVRRIHERYPRLHLISNNGFTLLSQIGPALSGALAEDIHGMVDFEKGGYRAVPPADREYKLKILKQVMNEYGLPVFNIDYASQNDPKQIQKYTNDSLALGFCPYVAEKDLAALYDQAI